MTEQRNYRRIAFHTTAEVLFEDRQSACDLLEIALRGTLVRIAEDIGLKIGERGQIRIGLPNSELNLTFGIELIHRQEDVCGFLFVDADDESLAHLRRLLELNFGDGEEVDREFMHWMQHPHQ